MAAVIGWRQAQHIGGGAPEAALVDDVATGAGAVWTVGVGAGVAARIGITGCAVFGALLPRSTLVPRVAKAAIKTTKRSATARVESSPLSPEVPIGSPEEVMAKLKVESLAVL